MNHLEYIINEKPKFNICIPSHGRPSGSTFVALKKSNYEGAYIYIDEIDNIEEYKKLNHNIIIGPKRNIAEKRYDIVKHQQSIGSEFIWCIDDDYKKFQTKDLNAKYFDIGISSLFSTAEQFIDITKDWFCKIMSGNIGLQLFGAEKKYIFNMPYINSKRTLFAGCYGLNIGFMKKRNINFDKNCPRGVGEDIELVCQFITKGFTGKTITFVEAVYDKAIKSQAWDINVENSAKANESQKHKDVYCYLKEKYPKIIYWDPKGKMGAVIHKTSIEYPDWYVPSKKTFKFGCLD